jgi:hypothetical protein
MANTMINNYRGELVTWERLFEVLEDYIEGRREYSYDEHGCVYRKDKTPDCTVACLIGSFIPDDKYDCDILESNAADEDAVVSTLNISKDVEVTSLSYIQMVHDSLSEGDTHMAFIWLSGIAVPTEYQSRKEEIIKKIGRIKTNG